MFNSLKRKYFVMTNKIHHEILNILAIYYTQLCTLYPPQKIYLYMSKGLFDISYYLSHYGLRNVGFKNTIEDVPFLNPENVYLDVTLSFFLILIRHVIKIKVSMYRYLLLCKTTFIWVSYFGQVGDPTVLNQNHAFHVILKK